MTITLDEELAFFVTEEAQRRGQDAAVYLARLVRRGMEAEASEYGTITLNSAERDSFLTHLDADVEVSPKARAAAERYRQGRQENEEYRW